MLSQAMCCGDTRIINERLSEISESVKDVLYNCSPPFVSAGHETEINKSERDVTFLSL